jgi:alpha-D-ribose 1-methylphosphonate 5-triphosphate diphosphatase
VLASDYYYPALLQAAFRLVRERDMPLAAVWPLISRHPASAAGLADRGTLAEGMRGDAVLVRADDGVPARVVATVAGGRLVYLAEDRLP